MSQAITSVAREHSAAADTRAPGTPAAPHGAGRVLPPDGRPILDVTEHLDCFGAVPYRGRHGELIEDVRAAGLTGRGGAAFPVHTKLAAVSSGQGRPVVVGNGAEGEPASSKDKVLLRLAPHLVLDGLQLAAEAVGAADAVLYAGEREAVLLDRVIARRLAASADLLPVRVVAAPPRFIAGQESALAARVGGGAALPAASPPRVFEHGVAGRPTLVQNVETLAHLSLIARYGPRWFRGAGTSDEPGTMLCTLRQPDGRVRVTEVALGTPLRELVDLNSAAAVLVGGYHGAWLPAGAARGLTLANAALRPLGAAVGAGVVAALPHDRCGLAETARIVRYLAAESASQCGPCLNGLPRMAGALGELTLAGRSGQAPRRGLTASLTRWAGLVEGRGACAHPDGTARFVRSALVTFAGEVSLHERGRCSARSDRPFLPVAEVPAGAADWSRS